MSDRTSDVPVQDVAGVAVAVPRGEIDMSNAQAILDVLVAAVPNTSRGVVVDLSRVTYLDSAGISVLFQLANRLRRRGLGLGLALPPASPLRRVLQVAGVDAVAAVHPSPEVAVESLRSTPPGPPAPVGPSEGAGPVDAPDGRG